MSPSCPAHDHSNFRPDRPTGKLSLTPAKQRLFRQRFAVMRRRHRLTLEAKRLLLYSDLTAAEIADRLGFADPAYFARFFRRRAGSPPTSYRADRRFA